jgi:hypothetical protein
MLIALAVGAALVGIVIRSLTGSMVPFILPRDAGAERTFRYWVADRLLNVSPIPWRRREIVSRTATTGKSIAINRNQQSDRSPARALCPIPRPKGYADLDGGDGHGLGPVGTRRCDERAPALDRHCCRHAGRRGLVAPPRWGKGVK